MATLSSGAVAGKGGPSFLAPFLKNYITHYVIVLAPTMGMLLSLIEIHLTCFKKNTGTRFVAFNYVFSFCPTLL